MNGSESICPAGIKIRDRRGAADNRQRLGDHVNSFPSRQSVRGRKAKPEFTIVITIPGRKDGSVCNEIISHLDWLPTFVAAAGNSSIKQELLDEYQALDGTWKEPSAVQADG